MINPELEKFISYEGNQANAARFLGCSEPAVYKMRNNEGGVSKVMAKRITDKYPTLNRMALLYPKSSEQAA